MMNHNNEGTPLINTISVTATTDPEDRGFVIVVPSMIGSNVRMPEAGGVQAEGPVLFHQATPITESRTWIGQPHYGSWRDGLCDCFRHGLFHPHLWMGFCFPLCLLGQVATRTGIWHEKLRPYGISAFRLFFAITMIMIISSNISNSIETTYALNDDDGLDFGDENYNDDTSMPLVPSVLLFLCRCVPFSGGIVGLVATIKVRQYIRRTYNIPSSQLLEDCCCACCCQSCTICQMARHTADYNAVDAEYCSETGLASYTMNAVVRV